MVIVPTSAAQRQATENDVLPPPEQVHERVWAVATAMPGDEHRLRYTLTYLLLDDDRRVHVVDPGWDTEENWATLRAAVDRVSPVGVGSIIATHLHPDHLGLAARLRAHTGAPVVLHEIEAAALSAMAAAPPPRVDDGWGVPADRQDEFAVLRLARDSFRSIVPDLTVRGTGGTLDHPGLPIRWLHTPGHTLGHICLRLPGPRLLLTGDHVLPARYPGVGLGGRSASNPLADYFDSLDLVSAFDDHEVLPGHHYRFRGLAERVAVIVAHHRRRNAQVAAVLRSEPRATVYRVAEELDWSAGWDRLRGFYLFSALAQTAMHVDLLRRA